jgi:D-lactate dehydrogenase
VLNPDAVLSEDPGIHLADLKSTPAIEDVSNANACIECGFCEPVCPSRDVTTTPRQRIVLRREMARQPEGSPVLAALERDYQYDGLDTCAADGSCKLVCPVGIDTGELVKSLRAASHSPAAESRALRAAERWSAVERASRAGLRAGGLAARAGVGSLIPRWLDSMPRAAPGRLPETRREGAAAVYLPACINRIFGVSRSGSERWVVDALVQASARAGRPVWIPPDAPGVCCGTPWTSKGYERGAEHMKSKLAESVARWTEGGELPLVIDATSCTHGIDESIEVIDAVAWAHDHLLPELEVRRRVAAATVHPTCSARHLDLAAPMEALARALADEVNVPLVATSCGKAGDRGLLHPELIESATAPEAKEVTGGSFDAHLSANRTCEIALEHATGRPYASLVQLLDDCTRP